MLKELKSCSLWTILGNPKWKTIVIIIMISLVSSFTVNRVYSQVEDLKPKKSPEERAKKMSEKMTKVLSLTNDQQSQAYNIVLSHCQKADEIRATAPDKAVCKEQMKLLRQSTDTQITAILTDEQVQKYNELKQKMKERKQQKKGKQKEKQGNIRLSALSRLTDYKVL